MASIGEDVLGILDVLGVERAVVVGHSLGGSVAMWLAMERAQRVAGVVGVAPIVPKESGKGRYEARIEAVKKGKS